MKYRQLTREQFEELHLEFAKFLATQQIDAAEWERIKADKPEMAEEELNIFSDIVWEDVLNKSKFIEHISQHQINLFQCNSKEMIRIVVEFKDKKRSFLNDPDFDWFAKNPMAEEITYFKASKAYTTSRNSEIFKLIELGGHISNGSLYKSIIQLIV